MTDDADKPDNAPQLVRLSDLPRVRMALLDQALALETLLGRCQMHGPDRRGQWAGDALLAVSREDMVAIKCVADTIRLFAAYRADDYVRREAQREVERKRGGRR